MKYQKIEENLKKIKYFFIFSGMKLHTLRGGTSRLKYRALSIFNLIWFNLAVLGSLSWLCDGILNRKTFTELSFVAPCLIFAVLGNAKAWFYTINDRKAYQLIEDLMKLDENRNNTDTSYLATEQEMKATETNFLKNVLSVLNVMYILLIIFYNVGPLLGTAISYFTAGEVVLLLPFLDVYPFDALSLKYWPYAYLHQAWAVCLVLFYSGAADCYLLICCAYIRIQFQLMKLDIENLIPAVDIASGPFRKDAHFRSKFQELVCRHQEIIRISSALQDIYSESILINVLTSSIVICLTGFNVTVIQELTLVLTSLVFLVTNLLQVFCLCYFGDLLMSSSELVEVAVYSSNWYLADKEIARQLLFILVRAQFPCKLSASAFMDVNLRAFMRILSTSWSYFALLRTMYSQ